MDSFSTATTSRNRNQLEQRQITTLLVSVFIIAICGLVYELIVGTLSSYLLGNSVTHFSITIGLFLSAMGIGSFLSRLVKRDVLHWFVMVEITIGIVGGGAAAVLYAIFATSEYFYPAMVTLILIIGGCIGMEIPLLMRLSRGYTTLKDTLANVLAFDYMGALIGSILFPIILLPQLGLLRTSFVIGLLNMTVAAVIVALFWQRLEHRQQLTVYVSVGMLILLSGGIWSADITNFFEKELYEDDIIYTQQTPYQRIVMTRWGDDLRLFLDGQLQFSLRDEYRYHEALVHPAMSLSRSPENVLVLGGGDGLAVRELVKYDEVQRIVLVDIDPAMTQLAMSHLSLRQANGDALFDERVEIIHDDAFNYLAENSDLFGVIIADLPDPNNESLSKLYSRSYYRLIERHLAAGGVFVSQSTSPYFAREAFWSIAKTIESELPHVVPYHVYVPSFGDWGFVMAAETALQPDGYNPAVEVRYLDADIFATSLIFDSDTAELPVEISTLDDPVVLRYYEKGWKEWR